MKLASVVKKSLIEQLRHFWIFVLTISMAPFFVFIYYLITEAEKPHYELLILNQDQGYEQFHYGNLLVEAAKQVDQDTMSIPLDITIVADRSRAIQKLKNKKADALVVIPDNFSERFHSLNSMDENAKIDIEIIGDLTDVNYMISAIWANDIVNRYIFDAIQKTNPIRIKETSLGISGKVNEFDLYVPGLLILSIIMLMFSATIAIISEVENRTIIRLKLSKISSFELLSGISVVQVLVGLISIVATLIVAVWLGFNFSGSLLLFILIAVLTSISIIAFSLIVAALTKTANEVLIVGNFPLFLFMFFTGAAFPIKGKELFSIAGYSFTWQGLMSPTHAVSALKKVMIMNMGWQDIFPEIFVLLIITMIYFVVGLWLFHRRHMRVA